MECLKATAAELSVLLRRTDEHLRETGLYRFTTDVAEQITTANAGQFLPEQLVGLRRLTARTANCQEPLGSGGMHCCTWRLSIRC